MSLYYVAVLILAQFWLCGSLKVQNFQSPVHSHEVKADIHHAVDRANKTRAQGLNKTISKFTFGIDAQHSINTSDSSSEYVGCNNSLCFMNSKKIKSTFRNELILILGCSLDINAISYFCSAATGANMDAIIQWTPFAYLVGCTVGQFTVAYAFHPGATPPPYSAGMMGMEALGTSRDIVTRTKHDIVAKFGREPSAIVVDASLWDVSNWWTRSGSPAYPYPIAPAFFQQWCTKDLPDFLTFIQATYPRVPIALRTAPTVFADPNSFGLSAASVEMMIACEEQHKDFSGRIYSDRGSFDVIDYHHFVDSTLMQASAGGVAGSTYYKDSLHPGAQLSMLYMNNILTWVQTRASLSR
jgi:hypothetical protein